MSFYEYVIKNSSLKKTNKKPVELNYTNSIHKIVDINTYQLIKNEDIKQIIHRNINENTNNSKISNSTYSYKFDNRLLDFENKSKLNTLINLNNINNNFSTSIKNEKDDYFKNSKSKFTFTSRNSNNDIKDVKKEDFNYKIIPYKNKKIIGVFPKIIKNVDNNKINSTLNNKFKNEIFPEIEKFLEKPIKISKEETNTLTNNFNITKLLETDDKLVLDSEKYETKLNLYVPQIRQPLKIIDKFKDVIVPSYTRKFCTKNMCKLVYDLKKMSKISLSKLNKKLFSPETKKNILRRSSKLSKCEKIKWGERLTLLLSLSRHENIRNNYSKIVKLFKKKFSESIQNQNIIKSKESCNEKSIDKINSVKLINLEETKDIKTNYECDSVNKEFEINEMSIKSKDFFNDERDIEDKIYITGFDSNYNKSKIIMNDKLTNNDNKRDKLLDRFRINKEVFMTLDKFIFCHDELESIVETFRNKKVNKLKQNTKNKQEKIEHNSTMKSMCKNFDNLSINSKISLASYMEDDNNIPVEKIKSYIKNSFKLENLNIDHLENQFNRYFKEFNKKNLIKRIKVEDKMVKKLKNIIKEEKYNDYNKIKEQKNFILKKENRLFIKTINKLNVSKIHYIK